MANKMQKFIVQKLLDDAAGVHTKATPAASE